jgi:hypothetical protein
MSSTAGGSNDSYYYQEVSATQSHSHSGGAKSPAAGAHTHSINDVASATSIPLYVNLFFIKRVG